MLSSEPDIPDVASSPRRAISATCCSPCAAMAHIGLRDSVLADPVERSAAGRPAAVEAHQEAGLVGKIEKSKLGRTIIKNV